jgi:type IV secretory pathway component VirB8
VAKFSGMTDTGMEVLCITLIILVHPLPTLSPYFYRDSQDTCIAKALHFV